MADNKDYGREALGIALDQSNQALRELDRRRDETIQHLNELNARRAELAARIDGLELTVKRLDHLANQDAQFRREVAAVARPDVDSGGLVV